MFLMKTRMDFPRVLIFAGAILLGFEAPVVSTLTEEDLKYGMDMVYRVLDAICYYEGGLRLPIPDSSKDLLFRCHFTTQDGPSKMPFYNSMPTEYKLHFRKDTMLGEHGGVLFDLPDGYKDTCKKFIEDEQAKPETDESSTLNDGGKDYPFKALAYCLLHHLRTAAGDEMFETVKKDRITGKKEWRQTILDRDNDLRARHGSPPFEMENELNEEAQKWAEQLAKECAIYHSTGQVRKSTLGREETGENLAMSTSRSTDKQLLSLLATNNWYSEISDYTYPDDMISPTESVPPGSFLGPGPGQIGHFTQQIWASSRKVGYGIACNPSCGRGGCYTVGRYYPPGNYMGRGMFKDNVKRPLY